MFLNKELKFCVDCRYSKPPATDTLSVAHYTKCEAPQLMKVFHPVSGTSSVTYADSVRGPLGGCGKEAKWFMPKV